MVEATDDYGKELEAQGKSLSAREEALAKEREGWLVAVNHYADFLRKSGRQVPIFATEIAERQARSLPAPQAYDGVTRVVRYSKPRIGEKRRTILLMIAKATRENRDITTEEIVGKTGFDQSVTSNVVWADYKRGMLDRKEAPRGHFHEYRMTDIGFDVLRKAGFEV